jgi:Subtilase family/FG-GAP-like repeat/FG-GAP repeat
MNHRSSWLRTGSGRVGPLLLVALGVVALCRDARAGWPPPLGATAQDMKNPANWPNDPGYGYKPSEKAADRESGQWQFYSFIPDRSPGAFVPDLRPGETAAGMSVDLAWRHTIGDDRVLIAVIDCGIKWDEADLAEKAYLNIGELASHPPLHADSSPCAPLDPQKPGEKLFDCNGDGIFTVSDYVDTPWLTPDADADHPRGDANRNKIFDAGDLIVMKNAAGQGVVSDGLDDDGNGYVDDISGWDFMKDDNDPYDDTRYGHGSGEARDSAAATNNGIGDAGVCPNCRFVMLRAGDSFITDVQDFAQAVVYASDNGAKVIQEALGTIDMSGYAQRAMDYAWSRGTVVVASMADENSRHHNVPATANHTMPVHAITILGPDSQSTAAQTFLSFNTCTNFGAQNFLSASGTGCSSEATGRLSGLSGLVYSMGVQSKLDPPLDAGEVMQIFFMTADDIDVAESRQGGSNYFWSQPGFDQRFGYGRVNANTAVEWVQAGKIPPEVDIVEPRWFQVLYPKQQTQAVEIRGTVRARRAPLYSVYVEWAPGVQPLDSEFKQIKKLENIKSSDMPVLGGDQEPLATLDIREISVKHEADVDSQHGENDRTITVRVRAVAHYGGEIGDVPGELRRAYSIHDDPDLLDGFPYDLGASGESSPKLADIDGDGVRDIVIGTADGKLHVLSMKSGKPAEVSGFPYLTTRVDGLNPDRTPSYLAAPAYTNTDSGVDPELAHEAIVGSPAVADVDGDGKPEIVLTTYAGTIHVVKNDATAFPGWPVRLPDVPSCTLGQPKVPPCMDADTIWARGAFGSPVLADMNGDGKLDIVQAAFDGQVHVYGLDGEELPGWPVSVHFEGGQGSSGEYNRIFTTPTVTDFNGDGIPDVLVGSSEKLGKAEGTGAFYLIDGRGTKLSPTPWMKNWPVSMVSFHLFPLVAEGVSNSPIAADMDGDGIPEAVMHGNASAPLIVPTDPGTQNLLGSPPKNSLPAVTDPETGVTTRGIAPTSIFGVDSKASIPDTMFPLFAQPSIGDLNQDGVPDVVASGGSLSMAQNLLSSQPAGGAAQHLLAMWDGATGKMLPGSPVVLEDFTFFNNQVIADLDNDGYPEVITGSGGYFVHAADGCGIEPSGWPKFMGQWVVSTAAVGDVTGDDLLDVVVGSRAGWLYAWRTPAKSDGVVQWESYHHDNRNTGYYGTPLDQGKLESGKGARELDGEGKCVIATGPAKHGTELSATGGCTCRSGRSSAPPAAAWLTLLPILGLVMRRRRHGLP